MISSIGGGASDMLALWREKLAAADADKSGGLSLDEFTQLGESRKTDDAKASGGVGDPAKLFAKLDGDGDGELSTEEMEKGRPPPPPPQKGAMDGAAMSMLLSMQEDDSGSKVEDLISQVAAKLIEAADTDGDGVVSAAEYAAQTADEGDEATSAFSTADADGDGALSSEELVTQLQDSLQQQLQAGGQRAYDRLISLFSEALDSGSQSAKTSSSLNIAA